MLSRTILRIRTPDGLRYSYPAGTFFIYHPDTKDAHLIGTCRDVMRWHWEFTNAIEGSMHRGTFHKVINPYIGMSCGQSWDIKRFAARWRDLEKTLDLTCYTQVHRTNAQGAIILKVAPFWLANDTRRFLLTLLMRALIWHGDVTDTLDQAIDLYPLAHSVKPAIKHFMSGHTQPSYERMTRTTSDQHSRGFVAQYIRRTPGSLKKMLIKP